MNNDLISREALKNVILNDRKLDGANANWEVNRILVHIDNAPAVETMNHDYQIKVNIPEEETQKLIEELQRCRPCILPESEFTDDDIQELIKENFNLGYEMAKNKYARSQGEWITANLDKPYARCSICGEICEIDNFCGNCGAKMQKGGAEKMIKINNEELDREDILKAVHLLDIFTKTFCRYRNDYERFADLKFRCDECPFQKENRDCLCKVFKNQYAPDYKDFGAMGDL